MEEIKSPVGVKRNDMWAAYKELLVEYKTLRAGKTGTITETAQKQMVDTAVKQQRNKTNQNLNLC